MEASGGTTADGWKIQLLISPAKESMLIIASEKMVAAMIRHLEFKYMDDMDADSYFDMKRLIEKED